MGWEAEGLAEGKHGCVGRFVGGGRQIGGEVAEGEGLVMKWVCDGDGLREGIGLGTETCLVRRMGWRREMVCGREMGLGRVMDLGMEVDWGVRKVGEGETLREMG